MQMKPSFKVMSTPYIPLSTKVFWGRRPHDVRDEFMERISEQIEKYEPVFKTLIHDISNLEIRSIRSSRTGNKVDMKVKLGSYTKVLHLCTCEYNEETQSRTLPLVEEECLLQIIQNFGIDGELNATLESRLVNVIQRGASKSSKDSVHPITISYHNVRFAIFQHLQGSYIHRGLKRIFDAYQDFVSQDEIRLCRNTHQTKRAIDSVRKATAHALDYGANIEDILAAVRETLVQNVLEK